MRVAWAPWRMTYIESGGPDPGCIFCVNDKGEPKDLVLATDPRAVVNLLELSKSDPDLASIRDADGLSAEFRQLWTNVDALLKRARDAKDGLGVRSSATDPSWSPCCSG